jgi:sugar/nucleoside kinase (ribokinase family)
MEQAFDTIVVGHITVDVNSLPWGVIENMLGGAPTYAGFALASLGKRVGVVSKIGRDFPDRFPPVYRRFGLDTEGILATPGETTTFENTYDDQGNREQRCRPIPSKISPEEIPGIYRGARSFYVSPVADEITPELLESLKEDDNIVVLDPQGLFRRIDEQGAVQVQKRDDLADFLANVDVVKIGKEELGAFPGDLKGALEELGKMGPEIAIATQGAAGCAILYKEGFSEVEGTKVDVKDLTGAGDVFGAAFLSRYLDTGKPVDSAKFASVAAGMKIRYKGPTGFPTEREILDALSHQ